MHKCTAEGGRPLYTKQRHGDLRDTREWTGEEWINLNRLKIKIFLTHKKCSLHDCGQNNFESQRKAHKMKGICIKKWNKPPGHETKLPCCRKPLPYSRNPGTCTHSSLVTHWRTCTFYPWCVGEDWTKPRWWGGDAWSVAYQSGGAKFSCARATQQGGSPLSV